MAAWLITAYYMAWFTIWFGCLFVACWAWRERQSLPDAGSVLLRRHAVPLAAGAAVFAIAAIPFLTVYLPKAHETGSTAMRR